MRNVSRPLPTTLVLTSNSDVVAEGIALRLDLMGRESACAEKSMAPTETEPVSCDAI